MVPEVRALLVLAIAPIGCRAEFGADFDIDPAIATIVFVFADPQAPTAIVLDRSSADAGEAIVALDPDVPTYTFLFEESPGVLMLPAEQFRLDDAGRTLPPPSSALIRVGEVWRALPDPRTAADTFRFPALDRLACVRRGGCPALDG